MTLRAIGMDGSPAVVGYESDGAGFGVAGERGNQIDYTFDGSEAASEMLQIDFAAPQTEIEVVLSRMSPNEGGLNRRLGGARRRWQHRGERRLRS